MHAALAATALLTFSLAARAQEILIVDAKSQPESLTATADGTLIVGSASTPFIYRVKPGGTAAEKFVDATADGPGTFFFGMLADAPTKTLWACELTPTPGITTVKRHTALRSFDLATGVPKVRWELPGDNTTCNDMTIGPDKAVYVSDTATGRIYRMAPDASTAELFLEHRVLTGIDGLTFLDGTLYINNVIFNKLYRIPVDAAGKAGTPVDIWMDQPVKGIDGMRAANGKIYAAENGSGKITSLTIDGDRAHVTVLKEGLKTPTGVEPAGTTLWIAERGAGKAVGMPMPK